MLEHNVFYLVGIKGVAMTALAQCLLDLGKTVLGCDVAEEFVTQPLLEKLAIKIDQGFSHELPPEVSCVVYTSAHQGKFNQIVQQASNKKILALSHAEALAELFNQKMGVAVCGVGGKSTTSAMITWILTQLNQDPSYLVGVGSIPGLEGTGKWNVSGKHFVAEADEYVTDPSAPSRGETITPRFSFLYPQTTVCTNLQFDHPDVYQNFEHTLLVFEAFFRQIKPQGNIIYNADDEALTALVAKVPGINNYSFGKAHTATVCISSFTTKPGKTFTELKIDDKIVTLELQIPGLFNAYNAAAALAAVKALGIDVVAAAESLKTFASTKRRAEFIGEKNGVRYYDDYAHHPHEIANIIAAYKAWFPNQRVVVGFQSHTFSRTKALFDDFVTALATADEVAMIDIFASAREKFDPSITSEQLCEAITKQNTKVVAKNYQSLEGLASYCQTQLQQGDIFITVGAGSIYQVHDLIK